MKKAKQNRETPQTGRKKTYALLIAGAVLVMISLILAVYHYNNSYKQSIDAGKELSAIKKQIEAVKEGTATGDLDALNASKTSLTAAKLNYEKPYSYSLALLFLSILLTVRGIFNATIGIDASKKVDIKKLAQAGLLAALCYIGFTFFKIDIPVGTEKTAFHFGNVFCVVAALLLGGYWGGLAGAIGMTIGDLTTSYVTSAPKTFFLKMMIGLIVGLVAHKIFKLNESHSPAYVTKVTILASVCGMGFNIIADPVTGYFYKTYLLGVPQDLAATLAKISAITTAVNAVVAVIVASVFYLALRPALKKAGLL